MLIYVVMSTIQLNITISKPKQMSIKRGYSHPQQFPIPYITY